MYEKKYDLSCYSQTLMYFKNLLPKIKDIKVKAIYTPRPFWGFNQAYKIEADDPVYILFENGKCLVIEYYFIDDLNIEYRKMTKDELNKFNNASYKDYFNREFDIYDGCALKPLEHYKIEFQYDSIVDMHIKKVTEEYNKWLDTGLDAVIPSNETFNEIEFIMDNGKSFKVLAEDSEMDGYVLVSSKDIKVLVRQIK